MDTKLLSNKVSLALVALVAICSTLNLLGWFSQTDFLKNPIYGQIPVAPTTATCFLLSVICFLAIYSGKSRKLGILIPALGAITIICTSVLAYNFYPTVSPDLEQLLFTNKLQDVHHFAPGRMSPSTAIYFLLVSVAIFAYDWKSRIPISQLVLVLTIFLALLNLIGYMYGLPYLCGLGAFTRIAAPTAVEFLCIGTALLLIRPNQAVTRLFLNEGFGGITARSLLPAAIIFPIFIGWIASTGETAGWWNWTFAAALMAVTSSSAFFVLVIVLSIKLGKMDDERMSVIEERENLAGQRDDFMAVLTHDLKNPLIGADRVLSGLLKGALGETTEKQAQALLLIKKSNEDLLVMVKTLLELYRFDRDSEVLQFEDTCVTKVVDEAFKRLSPLANSHQIELKRVAAESLPTVKIDEAAITHVLTNLIQNAIKFSPDGSTIEIVSETMDQDYVVIKVHDNGPGIPQEEQAYLFGSIKQGRKGQEYKTGTGLGLFLSHQIVKAHDGTLTCISAEGIGTTFAIMLPLANLTETEAVEANSPGS